MSDKLTDADLIYRLQLAKTNKTVPEAAKAAGVNVRNFQRSIADAKAKGLTAETRIRDPLGEAKNEIKRLKAALSAVEKHNDTAEAIRKEVFNLSEIAPEPPEWLLDKTDLIEGPGTPMVLWSDWHVGEKVDPREVGGINEFNSEIAEERFRILLTRTVGLVNHHMPAGVPGIVVCLGGDMITGEIHQELADTNDEYVLQSVKRVKSMLYRGIKEMADTFGAVFVPCVVGNHGRNTLKPRMKGRVFTNYEWNIYTDLEERFRDDERVTFHIPSGTDARFNVLGHRFLLTHGDTLGVKGGDGIIGALGPIKRGEFKVRGSEAQIGNDFDTILMGHWHQYIATRGLIVNNCLKGYDEFARLALRAPATPASQALWFVHHKWGINAQMEVYVQEPFNLKRRGKAAPKWVEVLDNEGR